MSLCLPRSFARSCAGAGRARRSRGAETREIITEAADGGVEGVDAAMGARLHHAAFHDGEHERRELGAIHAVRNARASVFQTLLDGAGPAVEVDGEQRAHRWVGLVELEGE